MNLEEKLRAQNQQLSDCLERIKEFCAGVWKDRLLPWFTNHDHEHSEEIIHLLNQLLVPLEKTPYSLNEHELFILLASAYLHDIGMQYLKVVKKAIETLTEEDYDQIRKDHAQKSFELILKRVSKAVERDDFHLPDCIDEEYAPVIARIAKGHSTEFFSEIIEDFKQDPRTPKGRKVRGEFLTALLMIADELDLQCKRVKFAETAKFALSAYSKLHWFIHHYIENVDIKAGTIKIVLRLPDKSKEYGLLLRELIEAKLIEQIEKANPIFAGATSNTFRLNPQIHIEIRDDRDGIKRELPEDAAQQLKKTTKSAVLEVLHDAPPKLLPPVYPKPSLIFTGRAEELSKFEKALRCANFISIEGLGGIGKTEFAARCIEKYIPEDRLVWFECLPDSKLDALIMSSGYPDVLKGENKTERAKYSGYRDLLERDGKIVFLDNFQDVTDQSFREFFRLSENYLRNAKIVLIAREHPDAGVRLAPVELEGLRDDAPDYAKKLIETYYSDVAIGDDALKDICNKVEGHPLAIDLLLQLLRYGESPDQLIRKIVTSSDKGDELSHRLLDEIFKHPKSSEDEKELLVNFSVFRSEVDKKAITFLHSGDTDNILRSLYDKKMITRSGDLIGTHPLIREFCHQRLKDKDTAHFKASEFLKSRRREKFEPLLEDEIYYHLWEGSFFAKAADLLCEKGRWFILSGHTNSFKENIEKCLTHGIERAEFYLFLGDIATIRGLWDDAAACFGKAFLFKNVDEKIMAEAYIKSGEILFRKGNVKEALKYFEDAYDISKKQGYRKEEARSLNDIGLVHRLYGKLDVSLSELETALHIRSTIPDKEGIAISLSNIGTVLHAKGDLPGALEKYEESLMIHKEIGNKEGIAVSLSNIGTVLHAKGDLPGALKKYEESLKINKEIGDKGGIASSLSNIGNVFHMKDNLPGALEKHQESLKILKEIGSKRGVAISLGMIGNVFREEGDLLGALEKYEESLTINKEIGDKGGIASSLGNIGNVLCEKGDLPKALEKYEESLKIHKEIGDKNGIAASLDNIGNVFCEKGDFPCSLEKHQESLKISEEIGDKDAIAASCHNIGTVFYEKEDFENALKYFWTSMALQSQMGIRKAATISYIFKIRKALGLKSFKQLAERTFHSLIHDLQSFVDLNEFTKDETVHLEMPKVGRNDPCPCGSGKKYKKCCGA